MTVRAAGFFSEPKVQFLQSILEEIKTGALEVPRFQRPFVWDDDRQLELLRSVREGLPIGSLMIWQTTAVVSATELLGERRLPKSTALIHRYLLDGQQRMATLYAALVPLAPDEDVPARTAYFDIEANDFVLCAPEEVEEKHLQLSVVLDSVKLRRVQRAFPDEVADRWIERSEEVAAAFKDYKLPTISIATDELDVAIRTFERVNTQGAKMSGVHMVHALSWSESFHLLDSMASLREEVLAPLGWGEIDDERILDLCRLRLGLPLDSSMGERLARELRQRPTVLREAIDDVARVAVFVRQCHVWSPRLLPYRQQLLVLSVPLRESPALNDDANGRLIAWFWASTLTGWFAGEGNAARLRLREALEDILVICSGTRSRPFGNRTRRQPLGLTFDVRTGRGRALVLLLATLKPQLPNGAPVELSAFLSGDQLELPWLVSRNLAQGDHGSPGNRFLLPVSSVGALWQYLKQRPWAVVCRVAATHAITEAAHNAFVAGDMRRFLEQRRSDLDSYEDRWLRMQLDALDRT